MKPRYSFSSRRTRHLNKIKKQKAKYPKLVKDIVKKSDIILEILDARFVDDTRNTELEKEIKNQDKKIIYVLNKSDLAQKKKLQLNPRVFTSCKTRRGIKKLRDLIKREAKISINKKLNPQNHISSVPRELKGGRAFARNSTSPLILSAGASRVGSITVGVIGYPNTGKSSLINLLIGRKSAPVASQAGFTKGMQKLKLTNEIILLDTPGVIPEKEYSNIEKEKIAKYAIVGGRSWTQIKEPELVIANIIKKYPDILENHYKVQAKGDTEILLEELGKKWNYFKKKGQTNEDKTSRKILKEWQEGIIKI